jgi:hypothetical protein
VLCGRSIHQLGVIWEKYTSTGCMLENTASTRLKDNLSMIEEIQVWRMPPSLRGSVEDFQLREIILHKKVQEDPYIPLKKPLGRH